MRIELDDIVDLDEDEARQALAPIAKAMIDLKEHQATVCFGGVRVGYMNNWNSKDHEFTGVGFMPDFGTYLNDRKIFPDMRESVRKTEHTRVIPTTSKQKQIVRVLLNVISSIGTQ